MGAKSTTMAGLSGTGDIMLTCFVNLSRNRTVGVRLGAGESLSDILSSMNQVSCWYSYSNFHEEKPFFSHYFVWENAKIPLLWVFPRIHQRFQNLQHVLVKYKKLLFHWSILVNT